MKKSPAIDLARILVAAGDTDADLLIKIRQALPGIVQDLARQVGEIEWAEMERKLRHTGMTSDRSERAKCIRDRATEYLRDLRPEDKQEIAARMLEEL